MRILLTGGLGNVGLSTLHALLPHGYFIRIFDLETRRNRRIIHQKLFRTNRDHIEIMWGNILDEKSVKKAVENIDIVLHIAAIIPPLSEINPGLARRVNVTGTKNLIQSLEQQANPAKFLLTSSIALYGDRRKNPLIRVGDSINPIPGDHYGQQKLEAETLVRDSTLQWTIFRLTMITNASKLELDPVMFEIPLNTHMEICQTEDVGFALANAVENTDIWGRIWNIGGGTNCRTTYRDFLRKMMNIFGIGKELPAKAFTEDPFCCGYIDDADQSNRFLHYQRHSLEDFYQIITKNRKTTRFFARLFQPIARAVILSRSPYYHQNSNQKHTKVKQP